MTTALLVGGLLSLIKFATWYLTSSNAILTDALESIINIAAGGFALFSLTVAALPKDRNHPHGHGKIEFVSAGFEGALVLIAGLIIIGKAIYNIYYPHHIGQLDLGILFTGFTGLVNYGLGRWLVNTGEKSNSLTLKADGRHLLVDAYSSVALIIGLGLVLLTGQLWLDNAIAIFFGLMIIIVGLKLVRSSVAGIMDEVDEDLIEGLVKVLDEKRKEDWIDVHKFRVIKYGSSLHIDCHLTLPCYYNLEESHQSVKDLELLMEEECQQPVELFIHTDPCDPDESCLVCSKPDCAIRKIEQQERVRWTVDNIMTDAKHKLKE